MRKGYKTVKVEFGNLRADALIHKTAPFPKVRLGPELQGGWVVPVSVRKAWFRRHGVGERLQDVLLSKRARDWYWRFLVLNPEQEIPDDMKGYALELRSQVKGEFEAATKCGELQRFVTSFAKALDRPLSDVDGTDTVSRFLVAFWLNSSAPLCCFTTEALTDFLGEIFPEYPDGFNYDAIEQRCKRLGLKKSKRQIIKVVIPLGEGEFRLK